MHFLLSATANQESHWRNNKNLNRVGNKNYKNHTLKKCNKVVKRSDCNGIVSVMHFIASKKYTLLLIIKAFVRTKVHSTMWHIIYECIYMSYHCLNTIVQNCTINQVYYTLLKYCISYILDIVNYPIVGIKLGQTV